MTAEIALLNRSALAFAADSAVTLRIGSSEKIYDSAEKIFEFSRSQPLGIMIYNNVEHVGIPLEVLVRKYRSDHATAYPNVEVAADTFLAYLEGVAHSIREELDYLYGVLVDPLTDLNREVVRVFRQQLSVTSKRVRDPVQVLSSELDKAIEREEEKALAGFLAEVSAEAFAERYKEVVSVAAQDFLRFAKPRAEELEKVMRLALAISRSSKGSSLRTGLVIGGFASDELFPTMVHAEIDGMYFGKLKVLSRNVIDIDRDGDRAQLVPFAQKEMADRFIYGIDDDFQGEIAQYVQSAVDGIMAARPRAFRAADRSAMRQRVLDGFNDMVTKLRHHERDSILDILNFMSKKELADMAHVLVELTSKKRRFSRDQETVGGPIDVAIITRNEGFIWIKRKHYFDRAENPGYYARSFGHQQGEL